MVEQHIFVNYSKWAVPKLNSTAPLLVTMGGSLMDLIGLHEATDVLECTLYVGMQWKDEYLEWSDTNFEIDGIVVDKDKIWLPDIVLLNGIGDSQKLRNLQPFVYITRKGEITWWAGGRLETKCTFDVSNYPFDTQICIMQFEPWVLKVDKVEYQTRNGISILEHYHKNGEWEIIQILEKTSLKDYGYGPRSRYEIQITVRRRYLYHVVNIVIPVVILSLINICAFIIPPSSGEKMTVCVSIFLSFAVYITVINTEMPKTSINLSIFGVLLCFQMFLSGASIVFASIILHIHHVSSAEMCCRIGKSRKSTGKKEDITCGNGHNDKDIIERNQTLAKRLDRIFVICYVFINIISFAVYVAASLS
ncbi:hypothetical protein FSP39_007641 [Pinctada imbricata]|uniref:Uncharacterized protein n=1 Tax=Pinctada imbricata TaxID=66713 RepID=A0AA89BQT2_PINIB|nr:hypothetical protein FSP39_007641 [Pinctada imbricata]